MTSEDFEVFCDARTPDNWNWMEQMHKDTEWARALDALDSMPPIKLAKHKPDVVECVTSGVEFDSDDMSVESMPELIAHYLEDSRMTGHVNTDLAM